MKFFVNENCIGCALCTGICPEEFTLKEDVAVARGEPLEGDAACLAQEAAQACPVNAIEQR